MVSTVGNRNPAQIVSLLLSAFFTGHSSMMVSYLIDTSIKYRCLEGNFYGFIPDNSTDRFYLKGSMLLLASSQLLSRSLGFALFAEMKSGVFVMKMVAAELFLYLLYKFMRRDLQWYLPYPKNNTSLRWLFSILTRIGEKVVIDFTR
jgi:hypothetical protein